MEATNGIIGPPELAFELSASSAAYDLHQKYDAYERNGVREYIVCQLHEHRRDWFAVRNGRYMGASRPTPTAA